MKENNPSKRCSRKACDNHGINDANGQGSTWYCDKHNRFYYMRCKAQHRGKAVPTYEQCEEMLKPCLNEHGELGACPSCGRQMQWRAGANKKKGPTISLQHNLDGTMCFICHSCNVGHRNSRFGDRFLEPTPVGFKHCGDCDTVKPLDQFHKDRRTRTGATGKCRECDNNRSREYLAAKNADPVKRAEHLAKKRDHIRKYRAAKKAAKQVATVQQELAI